MRAREAIESSIRVDDTIALVTGLRAETVAIAAVDRLGVRWPNGREERWEHPAADKLHTVIEGMGKGSTTF